MSKLSDELERQRSAKKKNELSASVNAKKEAIYLYIKDKKDVLGSTCVKDLNMFETGKRYLDWLYANGHVTREKKVVDKKRQYVYNAAIPYVNPVITSSDTSLEEVSLLQSVTRVFRLLDRPPTPTTKEQRQKARSHTFGSMQSSIDMFGNW